MVVGLDSDYSVVFDLSSVIGVECDGIWYGTIVSSGSFCEDHVNYLEWIHDLLQCFGVIDQLWK